MSVPIWVWAITLVAIVGLLLFDFFFHVRQAHVPTLKEAAIWSSIYVGVAILFGLLVLVFGGSDMGLEYFSGYVIEKALSVDNLFVFLVIIGSFAVPRQDQQKVLLFGIVFALIARTIFIFAGKALIENFTWAFYLFGAILIFTAVKMLAPEKEEGDDANNFIIRFAKKYLRTSDHYDGDKLFTVENGKRVLTPMLLVMVAIGGTDVLFAIDSVPAIYAVTTNVYLVFSATAFSLMGLRQLYFLIDGLLDRLIYLHYGLSLMLAFIGVKLVLEALHTNQLPFINGGEPLDVPTVSVGLSLLVILAILTVTVTASLLSPRGRVSSVVGSLERAANTYLHTAEYHVDADERTALYTQILELEGRVKALEEGLATRVMTETGTDRAVARAHALHAEASNGDSRPAEPGDATGV